MKDKQNKRKKLGQVSAFKKKKNNEISSILTYIVEKFLLKKKDLYTEISD